MDVNTGGGAGVSGDSIAGKVGEHGEGIAIGKGIDQRQQSTTVNVEGNTADLYRLVSSLESRMSSLESNVLTRFLIAEQQRNNTDDKLDEVREELRGEIRRRAEPIQGPTWMQVAQMVIWVALIAALLYFGNGVYLLASKFH